MPSNVRGNPSSSNLPLASDELLPATLSADDADDEESRRAGEDVSDDAGTSDPGGKTRGGGEAGAGGAACGPAEPEAGGNMALGAAFLLKSASCAGSVAGAFFRRDRYSAALSPGTAFAGHFSNTE